MNWLSGEIITAAEATEEEEVVVVAAAAEAAEKEAEEAVAEEVAESGRGCVVLKKRSGIVGTPVMSR